MVKITTTKLKEMKENGQKIVALTCYSYSMAELMIKSDIDIILTGDSVGMVELGYENTIPVTVDEMIHHTKAVNRSHPEALLVTDMPFMSFNISKNETLRAAGRLIKEGGAEAVKLEGGRTVAETTKFLVDNNVPVMGHLGLTPQAVHKMGGYKVQGKDSLERDNMIAEAKILESAGIFALVLECIPQDLAKIITNEVSIPTIGIGAGSYCDGQILVVNDMLGINPEFKPKFARRYAHLGEDILKAFNEYAEDVRKGKFPSEDESF